MLITDRNARSGGPQRLQHCDGILGVAMSDNKVLSKLQALYRLATLNDEEQKEFDAGKLDEARMNEARTASFLLLNHARVNSVKLKFEVPRQAPTPVKQQENRSPHPWWAGKQGNWAADPTDGSIFDMFRDLDNILRKQAEEVKRKEASRQKVRGAGVDQVIIDDPICDDDIGPTPFGSAKDGAASRPQSRPSKRYPSTGAPPLIESKFQNYCKVCGKVYQIGDQVWWVRSVGCSHKDCGYEQLRDIASDQERKAGGV